MTQEAITKCLQNGSLTSYEMENLTGIPRTSLVAACKKLINKEQITAENIKSGRSWIKKYTLVGKYVEPERKINPYDIHNSQGIFSKAEYAAMNAQARRLFGNPDFSKDISNNQSI